jgi:hypothetical protein
MTQLILDIARRHHGMSDFLAQHLPVSFTQTMERLVDRVLSHCEFFGDLCLRPAIGFLCEQRFQAFE